MSARTATAKILPFNPDNLLVDSAFTTRSSEVHIRTGPMNDSVNAEVKISREDNPSPRVKHPVSVFWKMFRFTLGNGECQRTELHDGSHHDMMFAVDEIEAFATALYQAVQLAKKQGYLPSGKES